MPPVNCSRSRADFGLGRCDCFEDRSVLANRLQHTPTDSDSGSDRSFYGRLTSDFPAPPPIGSPAIRRMRSSPWMLNNPAIAGVWPGTDDWDMTGSIPWSSMATTSMGVDTPIVARQPCPQCSPLPLAPSNSPGSDMDSLLPIGQREHKLDIDTDRVENMNTLFARSWFDENDEGNLASLLTDDIPIHKREQPSRLPHCQPPQKASPPPDDASCSIKRAVGETFNNKNAPHSAIKLPRIIRKVTSMNLAAKGFLLDDGAYHSTPMPRCHSFLPIPCSAESKRLFQKDRCSDTAELCPQPQDSLFAPPYYSTTGGHQLTEAILIEPTAKPTTYDRVPLQRSSESNIIHADADPEILPGGGSSFQLGAGRCSNTAHQKNPEHSNLHVSRSFIDFTQARTESSVGAKKERMKIRIAKASGGIIGWGKNLFNKKKSS